VRIGKTERILRWEGGKRKRSTPKNYHLINNLLKEKDNRGEATSSISPLGKRTTSTTFNKKKKMKLVLQKKKREKTTLLALRQEEKLKRRAGSERGGKGKKKLPLLLCREKKRKTRESIRNDDACRKRRRKCTSDAYRYQGKKKKENLHDRHLTRTRGKAIAEMQVRKKKKK